MCKQGNENKMWLKCKHRNNGAFANVIHISAPVPFSPQSGLVHKLYEVGGGCFWRLEVGTLSLRTLWWSCFIECYQSEIGCVWFFKMTFCLSEFEVSCLVARCYDRRIRFVAVFMLFGNITVPQENGKNPMYGSFSEINDKKLILTNLCKLLDRNRCTYHVFNKAVLFIQ